jgi:hypothetical protein
MDAAAHYAENDPRPTHLRFHSGQNNKCTLNTGNGNVNALILEDFEAKRGYEYSVQSQRSVK